MAPYASLYGSLSNVRVVTLPRSRADEEEVIKLAQSKPNDLDAANHLPLVTPPPTLEGSMRDYQIEGLSWMVNLWDNESTGGILADEMVRLDPFCNVPST